MQNVNISEIRPLRESKRYESSPIREQESTGACPLITSSLGKPYQNTVGAKIRCEKPVIKAGKLVLV